MKNNIVRWLFYLLAFAIVAFISYLLPEQPVVLFGLLGLFKTPEQKANAVVSTGTTALSGIMSLIGAGIQNRMNIKNWQLANEYNSPSNQMSRFKSAGLNPNLIYERGDSGNASSLPAYQLDAGSVKNGIAASAAMKQLQLLDAEKYKAEQEGLSVEKDNAMKSKQNFYLDSYLSTRNKMQRAQWMYTMGMIGKQELEKELVAAQTQKVLTDTAFTDYNMTEYLPEQLKQGWGRLALDRIRTEIQQTLGWDQHIYNGFENGMAQFHYNNREADRTFDRRTRALGVAAGATLGLTRWGNFFGNRRSSPVGKIYGSIYE